MRVVMVLTVLRWASALRFGRFNLASSYTTAMTTGSKGVTTELRAENRNFKDDFTGTRIFVQNLPLTVDWKQLKDHFKTAGSVVYASVSCDPVTKQSKGHGIVQYESTDEATHALATMNNKMLGNSELRLRADLQERRNPDKTAIQKTHWSAQPQRNNKPAAVSAVRPGDRPREEVIKQREVKKVEKTPAPRPISTKMSASTIMPPAEVEAEKEEMTEVGVARDSILRRRKLLNLLDNVEEEEVEVKAPVRAVEPAPVKAAAAKTVTRAEKAEVPTYSIDEEESIAGQHEFVRIKKNAALKAAKKASGLWTRDSALTDEITEEEADIIQGIVMDREALRVGKKFEDADMIRMALRRERRVQLDDSKMTWRVLPIKVIEPTPL